MRRFFVVSAVAAALFVTAGAAPGRAEVLIVINKSNQSMDVVVDGRERYRWAVSTGLGGGPPSGQYQPERMERVWHSRKYDWAPMPNAIFFHKGYAIHGTYSVSRLGRPASHGCVRLHPSHAAALFDLVRREGMGRTHIVVSGMSRFAEGR